MVILNEEKMPDLYSKFPKLQFLSIFPNQTKQIKTKQKKTNMA